MSAIENKRLFDLVRYMRSELSHAGLITQDEYTWLLTAADEGKTGQGSISARRLEDYDRLRERLDQKWIAVSDRLPEGRYEVITWDGQFVDHFMPETGDTPDCQPKERCADHGVTHWMPLPQPPENPKL